MNTWHTIFNRFTRNLKPHICVLLHIFRYELRSIEKGHFMRLFCASFSRDGAATCQWPYKLHSLLLEAWERLNGFSWNLVWTSFVLRNNVITINLSTPNFQQRYVNVMFLHSKGSFSRPTDFTRSVNSIDLVTSKTETYLVITFGKSNWTINNRKMKTEIDISCREWSSHEFFSPHEHTTVVIIIAGSNAYGETSFVYTLQCSSRKSNYSQLFSSFLGFSNKIARTLLCDSFNCRWLCFVRVTLFLFIVLSFYHRIVTNIYCIILFVSTLKLPLSLGRIRRHRHNFLSDL